MAKQRFRTGRIFGTVTALALIAACVPLKVSGPNYAGPGNTMAATWQAARPHNASKAALDQWWQQFDDPVLVRLINQAQAENATLAQAFDRPQN